MSRISEAIEVAAPGRAAGIDGVVQRDHELDRPGGTSGRQPTEIGRSA